MAAYRVADAVEDRVNACADVPQPEERGKGNKCNQQGILYG